MIKGLGKILWSVSSFVLKKIWLAITTYYTTRLQTFYCHDILDISLIIKNQPELQILGLYTPNSPRNTLKTLKKLRTGNDAQSLLPIIFTFERENFLSTSHISIFPAFYSVDRRATSSIHQALAQSFCIKIEVVPIRTALINSPSI